jgi:hypothetical protein
MHPKHVAYHEAGHAIMARYLGSRPVVELALAPRPGVAGVCRYGPPQLADAALQARHDILVHVAGRAAERRLLGCEPQRPMLSDARQAMELARTLAASEPGARHLVVRSYSRACELFAGVELWWKVEAVAEALFARRRLDGRQVEHLARTLGLG